jgi:hypothetical protein
VTFEGLQELESAEGGHESVEGEAAGCAQTSAPATSPHLANAALTASTRRSLSII